MVFVKKLGDKFQSILLLWVNFHLFITLFKNIIYFFFLLLLKAPQLLDFRIYTILVKKIDISSNLLEILPNLIVLIIFLTNKVRLINN